MGFNSGFKGLNLATIAAFRVLSGSLFSRQPNIRQYLISTIENVVTLITEFTDECNGSIQVVAK